MKHKQSTGSNTKLNQLKTELSSTHNNSRYNHEYTFSTSSRCTDVFNLSTELENNVDNITMSNTKKTSKHNLS